MGGVVLLTGGTGFLGTQIARRVVREPDTQLILLVRAPDSESAGRRLNRSFWDWPELRESLATRIEAVAGDISKPALGLPKAQYRQLVGRVTHIIHAAADIRLVAPVESLHRANVEGVAHIIEFARAVNADHGLERLAHVSTAYVAGRRTGVISEEALTAEFGFTNPYEQTKYEGECLVQEARNDLPVSVFRPAMIVGDSETGVISTFNTFYYPLRRYLIDRTRLSASRSRLRINIIPVDYVADVIVRLTFSPQAAGLTFHLTAPHAALPAVAEVTEAVRRWAATRLGVSLPRPLFVPYRLATTALPLRDTRLRALMPYFNEKREFRRTNVDRLIGPYSLDWRVYLPRLLQFATARAFMNSSGRTVHEQVLFRLASHAGPVRLHDILERETIATEPAQLRRQILRAAAALRAMGITKGSRVAIVGVNSTRYLTLDVAIGLCGAISVPLYYTSPPAEVEAILRSSRAELLLVGAPAILNRLSELSTAIPAVSFWRGPLPPALEGRITSWSEFLAKGIGKPQPAEAPVELGDVASIRYTSGTTAAPKGVVFTHGQLRWMAETLVSLLPWRTRKGVNHYLSFLPLNHVVEGILCTYASYDLPGATNIYFLENFGRLAASMRKVRPTIFFGVPRIYEKAWAQVSRSPLGNAVMRLPTSLRRRLLRPLILGATGLDRCDQLLVGSAPPGDALLEAYHGVGIEIHNAYGLTEAPLVAFNRLGRNHIGTVGEPLPETDVRIEPDGEILVRGPQVSHGYDDPSIPMLDQRGWLPTGDLGHLSTDGDLVIDGRQKELIATSYAKKVSPQKVEVLLRAIPEVTEAMLVGDRRPYCAALLWVDGKEADGKRIRSINEAMARVGRQLAPPERPRRWAILPNDLSVERGDLTANLKPRRAALLRRYASVIDALYTEGQSAEYAVGSGDLKARAAVGEGR